MADNGTRKKRPRGPKYHRYGKLIKPSNLDPLITYELNSQGKKINKKRNVKIRFLPLGLKQILIERGLYQDWQRYFQENGIQIIEKDDINPSRRTTQKRRPTEASEASEASEPPSPVSAPESVTSVEIPAPAPKPSAPRMIRRVISEPKIVVRPPTPTTLYPLHLPAGCAGHCQPSPSMGRHA